MKIQQNKEFGAPLSYILAQFYIVKFTLLSKCSKIQLQISPAIYLKLIILELSKFTHSIHIYVKYIRMTGMVYAQ